MRSLLSRSQQRLARTALVFLAVWMAIVATATAQSGPLVGTIHGTFAVGSSGGATYHIPLELPPGTAHMQPELALAYTSHGGNGLVGMGWRLTGLSAITRCPATVAQDGFFGAITYGDDDRFCLDGHRLMAIENADGQKLTTPAQRAAAYGDDGTIYHTEIETWQKVVSSSASGIDGPASFRVWTKQGHTLEYGRADADGKFSSRVMALGKKSVRVWALNKITDLNGNYLTVTYGSDAGAGNYYPLQVDYTGNTEGSLTPGRRVTFAYDHARHDAVPTYVGGASVEQRSLLQSLTTSVAGETVRTYELAFERGQATGRNRLVSVTEKAANGQGLSATTFTWQDNNPQDRIGSGSQLPAFDDVVGATVLPMDANGDGLIDLVATATTPDNPVVLTPFLSTSTGFQKAKGLRSRNAQGSWTTAAMDVNGDGLVDVVGLARPAQGHLSTAVFLAQNGADGFAGFHDAVPQEHRDVAGGVDVVSADVNGDGRSDLVAMANNAGADIEILVLLSNGSGFETASRQSPSGLEGGAGLVLMPADVNGDGMADMVYATNQGDSELALHVQLATPKGLTASTRETRAAIQGGGPLMPMDVNGDGKSDLVFLASNDGSPVEAWPLLSDGVDAFTAPESPFRADISGSGDVLPMDINADSLMDLAYVVNNPGEAIEIRFFVSNGATFVADSSVVSGPQGGMPLFPMDVNGDRKTDIVGADLVTATTRLEVTPFIATQPLVAPDLLSSTTNGLGGQNQMSYLPLTDDRVYSRGASDKTKYEVAGLVNQVDGSRFEASVGASGITGGTHGATYPVVTVQLPTYVLHQHQQLHGQGVSYGYTYTYSNGRVARNGRGWLGFETQVLVDPNLGNTTVTTFNQSFPFAATLAKETVGVSASEELVHERSVTYASPDSPLSNVVSQVLKATESISRYNQGQLDYTLGRQLTYDDYGNVTVLADLGATAGSVPSAPAYTANTYVNDTSQWRLGYPVEKKVTADQGGTTVLQWTKKSYDAKMNLTSQEIWQGASASNPWLVTGYDYDSYGNRVRITDPAGGVTTTTYDQASHTFPATVTRPPNAQGTTLPPLRYTYDPKFGKRVSTIDENGHTWTQTLDALGRPSQRHGPNPTQGGGSVLLETQGWQASGGEIYLQKREALDWSGQSFKFHRKYKDGFGRTYREEMSGPTGQTKVVERSYDSANRIVRRTFPFYEGDTAFAITRSFDHHGRLTQTQETVSAQQTITNTYQYPGGGETVETRASGTPGATTLKTYDGYYLNKAHQVARVDGGQAKTTFQRDHLGRVTRVATQGSSVVTNTRYDGQSRQTSVEVAEADGSTVYLSFDYAYDEHQRSLTQTDSDHNVVTFTYDALHRLISRQSVDGTTSRTTTTRFVYDDPTHTNSLGLLSTVTTKGAESYGFDYDAYGNQSEIHLTFEGTSYKTQRTYLPTRKIAQETLPDGATRVHSYYGDAHLESVRLNGTPYVTYRDYAAIGKPGTLLFGHTEDATASTAFGYDELGRLTSHEITSGGQKILDRTLDWGPLHRLESSTDSVAATDSRSFAYDPSGRLTAVSAKTGSTELASFGYDSTGNLTTQGKTRYSYQGFGVTGGSNGFQARYDGVGNLTSAQHGGTSWTYTYDALNRLTKAEKGGFTTAFTYDYTGRRLKKATPDGTMTYYVTPSYVVTSMPKDGTLKTIYVEGHGDTLAAITTGTSDVGGSGGVPSTGTRYFHLDHLGSTLFATDAKGAVKTTVDYSPYGRATLQGPDDFRKKFTGMELDQTDLYYYRARYYNPTLGRFLTADSEIGGHAPRPDKFNRYAYALNDPALYVDPTGHMATWLEDTLQISLDVAEVTAGVIITVGTDGALGSTVGASLIGAGLSGAIYNFSHLSHPSWKGWGIQQAIGAVGGLITGGVGAASSAVVDSAFFEGLTEAVDNPNAFGEAEWLARGIQNTAKIGLKFGTPVAFGALAGAASSVSSQLITNWAHGDSFTGGFKHLRAGPVLIGALTGGTAAGLSMTTEGAFGLEKPDLNDSAGTFGARWFRFAVNRVELATSGYQWAQLLKPMTFNANKLVTHYEPNW